MELNQTMSRDDLIRAARATNLYTQRELAERFGVSRQLISHILRRPVRTETRKWWGRTFHGRRGPHQHRGWRTLLRAPDGKWLRQRPLGGAS